MVEIFQKTNRRYTRLKNRENYHIYRELGKIPTRYTKYCDLNDEQRTRWKEAVRKSQLKRRQTDPKYRALLSYRALEYEQFQNGRTKVCSKCHEEKGWVAFNLRDPKQPITKYQHASNTAKRTLRPECKACRKKYNKERYEARRLHKGVKASN